ncbi:MAG: hypothetical protein LBD24_05560, partial [Spirochaetaceae bacterium]|nr:hypothetical protein [Spirochaetaceae bacterium]
MNAAFTREALVAALFARRRKQPRSARSRPQKPTRWLYPLSVERRYAAAVRAWLRPMKEFVHEYLKNNREAMLRGDAAALVRQDAVPGGSYRRMVRSLNGWLTAYTPPLDDDGNRASPPVIFAGLGNIAEEVNDFNGKQWDKSANAALGAEFPVYEDWWPTVKEDWTRTNYELMRGLGQDYIKQVNTLAERAVISGWSPARLANEIMLADRRVSKVRAELIAADRIGTLNGMVTQARMEGAGLTMYLWSTSGDGRVRHAHALMDGALCRWDDSSVYSDDGGKT